MFNVNNKKYACLAPMAGVSDSPFRELCISYGAAYVTTEMVSAKGITYDNNKTLDLMKISNKEQPCSIQLFGNDPEIMKLAAKTSLEFKPKAIDINMGCPVPKVTSIGCGSSLMKNPVLCGKIVNSVKTSVDIPVTVKIRKGWDKNSVNAVEIAKICEYNGADAIVVHGRTKEDMYNPGIDLDIIKQVKKNVSIPVIGNGDIKNVVDAKNMMDITGCDMVMIGRGALGNPWIFKEINDFFNHGTIPKNHDLDEVMDIMLKHIKNICHYKSERIGIKEARKHISWYIKGIKNAAYFRNRAMSLTNIYELEILTKDILKSNT